MADVDDRWFRTDTTTGERVPTARHGVGKRWVARWRDDAGAQRYKAFDRKVDATQWVANISADLHRGTYIDPAAGKVSFADYAEQWRADQLHHRPATAAQAESRLRLWVYPVIGDRPMSTIRRSDVQRAGASLTYVPPPASSSDSASVRRSKPSGRRWRWPSPWKVAMRRWRWPRRMLRWPRPAACRVRTA